MTDMIAAWVLSALGYLCTTSPADAVGDPGSSGPLLGNVAVAGGAGLISLVCIVAAPCPSPSYVRMFGCTFGCVCA